MDVGRRKTPDLQLVGVHRHILAEPCRSVELPVPRRVLSRERPPRRAQLALECDTVAACISWSGTRQADGSPVEGRGTYHCRVTGEGVQEDWDVFFQPAERLAILK
jgi:hypothetical protein